MSTPAASAVLPTLRFPVGALERREGPWADKTSGGIMTAAQQTVDTFDVPAGGFLRGLWLEVTAEGGTGTAAVYKADAPWSAIADLTVMDPDGTPVIGPLNGWDLFEINLLAGLDGFKDSPANQIGYTAPTSGNFHYFLYLPFEMIGRDAIGALRNGASNSTLKVRITQGATTDVFSTNPTTVPTLRFRMWSDLWVKPSNSVSPSGKPYADRPFGDGAYQMWTKQQYPIQVGLNTIPLRRLGNHFRQMIAVTRDASDVRSSSIITANTPVRFMYEGNELYSDYASLNQLLLQKRTGLPTASIPAGTYMYDWTHEFDGSVGGELRDQWLPTLPGSRMELQFTAAAAGKLLLLSNDVYLPEGSPLIP